MGRQRDTKHSMQGAQLGRRVPLPSHDPLEALELETRALEARRVADERTRAKQEKAARVLSEVRRRIHRDPTPRADVPLLFDRS